MYILMILMNDFAYDVSVLDNLRHVFRANIEESNTHAHV